MLKSTSGLIVLSAVIAVVLWLLATAAERYIRPAPQAVESGLAGDGAAPARDLTPAIPEPAAPEAMSCEESEIRLAGIVEESRFCSTDEDCTLFDYGYPIDCMTSVAKSEIPLLREEFKRYDETCEHRVFYDCPTEPYVRLALCRQNRCVVELDTALRDSTLEHLRRREPR